MEPSAEAWAGKKDSLSAGESDLSAVERTVSRTALGLVDWKGNRTVGYLVSKTVATSANSGVGYLAGSREFRMDGQWEILLADTTADLREKWLGNKKAHEMVAEMDTQKVPQTAAWKDCVRVPQWDLPTEPGWAAG